MTILDLLKYLKSKRQPLRLTFEASPDERTITVTMRSKTGGEMMVLTNEFIADIEDDTYICEKLQQKIDKLTAS